VRRTHLPGRNAVGHRRRQEALKGLPHAEAEGKTAGGPGRLQGPKLGGRGPAVNHQHRTPKAPDQPADPFVQLLAGHYF